MVRVHLVNVHVCTCMYMYVHVCTCMYMYVYMYVCMLYVQVRMCTCTHMYVHVCVHVCMYVVCTGMCTCTHMYVHVCIMLCSVYVRMYALLHTYNACMNVHVSGVITKARLFTWDMVWAKSINKCTYSSRQSINDTSGGSGMLFFHPCCNHNSISLT